MSYTLRYHPDVKKFDLPKIDHKNKAMLKKANEERLALHPEIYGKPLQRTLKGHWKFRVGNYRVIFKVSGSDILILGIIHRKDVYHQIEARAK